MTNRKSQEQTKKTQIGKLRSKSRNTFSNRETKIQITNIQHQYRKHNGKSQNTTTLTFAIKSRNRLSTNALFFTLRLFVVIFPYLQLCFWICCRDSIVCTSGPLYNTFLYINTTGPAGVAKT